MKENKKIDNEEPKKDVSEKERSIFLLPLLIIFGIVFFLITLGFYMKTYGFGFDKIVDDHNRWAQFGDFFGGVLNPLFSFLSFLGVIITLNLQMKELQKQKQQIEDDKKERDLDKRLSIFLKIIKNHALIIRSASQDKFKGGECVANAILDYNPTIPEGFTISENGYKAALDSYYRSLGTICFYINNEKDKYTQGMMKMMLYPHIIEFTLDKIDTINSIGSEYKTIIKETLKGYKTIQR